MRLRPIRLSPFLLAIPLILLILSQAASRAESRMELRAGDEVYACSSVPECGFGTLSRVSNVCGCGRNLVKARVVEVEGEKATLVVDGRAKAFRTVGRYACDCRENCGCGTISQRPGKCACGRILLPLRKTLME